MRTLGRILLFGLIPLCALLQGCRDHDLPTYPMQLSQRVELPNNTRDEEIRYVTYAQDGVTPVSLRVEFRNGNTAHATYHPNGKVSEWTEFYPAGLDGSRQLRLKATLSPTEHYKTDELYRENGSLARQGREVNREYYDARWFFEDGTTVSRHKQIRLDAGKTVYLDEKFRPTGTMISQLRRFPDGKVITTSFSEEGKVTTRWTTSNGYGAGAQFEQYYPDGVNIKVKADYQPIATYVEYLRLDGSVEQLRLRNKLFNDLQVALIDANGKLIFRQVWRFSSGETGKLLRQLFDLQNGKVREIRLYPDGKTPSSITVDKKFEKTYRKDGTLEKEVDLDSGATRRFTPEDNIREHLPASYLVDPPHEDIPAGPPKED